MSRIGKQPVAIPEKVDLKINNGVVQVKGPKGELSYTLTENVNVAIEDKNVLVKPADESQKK
jgi:large subunit ribosomal protein L6